MPRTRINHNKEQIFCEWRRRWVRLTPEEWVRQQLLHRLTAMGYPASRIAVEVPLPLLNGKAYRADAVVCDSALRPRMVIECKAETVPLTQAVLDQVLAYNRLLGVPWLLLHNGLRSVCVRIEGAEVSFSDTIPPFASVEDKTSGPAQ